jgi:hypothetical protein
MIVDRLIKRLKGVRARLDMNRMYAYTHKNKRGGLTGGTVRLGDSTSASFTVSRESTLPTLGYHLAFYRQFESDYHMHLMLGFLGFSTHLSVESPLTRFRKDSILIKGAASRHFEATIVVHPEGRGRYEAILNWSLWGEEAGGLRRLGMNEQHAWMSYSKNLTRLLFGKAERTVAEDYGTEHRTLLFPEGPYDVKVTVQKYKIKRDRGLGNGMTYIAAEIEPLVPVPIPGKGDNGWDCDEDAVYISYIPIEGSHANYHQEAARQFYLKTMEHRIKRGGLNWKPEKREEADA